MTKYYKRIKVGNLSYSQDIIYPNDGTKDATGKFECSVKRSVELFPKRWKEVSKQEYLEQEGWYIKGSEEFAEWIENNNLLVDFQGNYQQLFYFKDENNSWKFSEFKPKGIEITVDELDEIFNIKTKENKMEQFSVKVNPTTSKILQELAFENGWRWSGTGYKQEVNNTSKPYLYFWKDKTICYQTYDDKDKNFPRVSLEEAIELITKKEEKFKEGAWVVSEYGSIIQIVTLNGTYASGFGWDNSSSSDDKWRDKLSFHIKCKATDKEVENALIEEAKLRGFPVKKWKFNNIPFSNLKLKHSWKYYSETDTLKLQCGIIYKNGKWAEIIDEPVEIFGFKVTKLQNGDYKFGCNDHVYSQSELLRIADTLGEIQGRHTIQELYHELCEIVDS